MFFRPALGAVHVAGVLALVAVGATRFASAQTAGEQDARGSDSDPTRPVFFSLRPEYYATGGDARQLALIFRYDTATVRVRSVGAILRLELPVGGARAGDASAGGVGDVYAQILVPWAVTRRFAIAAGSGVIVPTADSALLGGGKWTMSPLVAPVWRLPRGLFYVKVQYSRSIAGDAGRPDVDVLVVTPTLTHVISRAWWMTADSESRTNRMSGGRTDLRSGFMVGRIVAPGVGAWIKPEVWWGPNRDGRWNLKFGLVWYSRRPPS